MQRKLFSNIRKITSAFCVSILCVTLSTLALRLTVFSDMAVAPESVESSMQSSEDGHYQLNRKIYFSAADAKGDLFLSNLSEDKLIKVNIVLADSGQSILSTGFIKPGGTMNSSPLNPLGMQLAEGRYDCIAEVAAYDESDVKTVLGTMEMEIEVYIGEKPKR